MDQCGRGRPDAVLARATDLGTMRAAMARHLSDGAALVDFRVCRYRHRPGRRCIVQYLLRVRSTADVETEHRVTGQWFESEGRAAHVFRQVTRLVARGADDWTAPLPPVFLDVDTSMVATTYPWDRRLHGLPVVASGRAPEVLMPMLASMGAGWDQFGGCDVHAARYREQLAAVCRYTVRANLESVYPTVRRFFAKVYADDDGARVAAILRALAVATADMAGAALVEPPVAYLADLRTLIVAEVAGGSSEAALADPADLVELERRLVLAATALCRFGRLQIASAPFRAPRDARLAFGRARDAIAGALPGLGHALASIQRAADVACTVQIDGLVHGDVKLEHVFIDGDRVRLIDLDSAHRGDPRWDQALFGARWWVGADSSAITLPLRDWGRSVIDRAYFRDAPPEWRHGVWAAQALALVDVAAGLVKRQEPDWSRRTERAVADAARLAGVAS